MTDKELVLPPRASEARRDSNDRPWYPCSFCHALDANDDESVLIQHLESAHRKDDGQ